MRLSVVTSVLLNYSIYEAIDLVARSGYEGIDLWGGRPHIYRRDWSHGEMTRLRRQLSDCNLIAPSLMPAFFRYPFSLSNPNEVIRQDSIAYMRECVDNAAVLGVEKVLVAPGRRLVGQSAEDARGRLRDSIAAIAEYSKQYTLRLMIEPANRMVTDLVNTSGDALEIIRELGYSNLGVVLDVGHLNLTGERPEEAIRNVGEYLLGFHVNDNDGRRQQNLIPGEGTVDLTGLFAALGQAGYQGFLSVELAWDYSLDPEPAIREAASRLRRALAASQIAST